MIDEAFEFQLSRYFDGETSAEESTFIAQRLAADPEARAALSDIMRLDAALKASVVPPAIDFDALHADISARLDAANDEQLAGETRGRGFWANTRMRIGAAASLAAAIAIAFGILHNRPGDESKLSRPTVAAVGQENGALAMVSGPKAEAPLGAELVNIEIGPPTLAQRPRRPADWYTTESLMSQPSRIEVLATTATPAYDSGWPIH